MLNFSDIDECIGSYNCTCKEGFTGDGAPCTGKFITDNLPLQKFHMNMFQNHMWSHM